MLLQLLFLFLLLLACCLGIEREKREVTARRQPRLAEGPRWRNKGGRGLGGLLCVGGKQRIFVGVGGGARETCRQEDNPKP